jgi:transposase
MERMHDCCCGIDIHARTAVVCLMKKGKKEIRKFSTMTDSLLELLDWLKANGCTHVAIESTGVYWKPVFNIVEGEVEVILVNARHIKGVPGRKTDVKDCEWLAELLSYGLLKPSFIPPKPIRDLRELTRYRESLVRERTTLANRIQKEVESANIKLGQVASNSLGTSGYEMLRALANGETDVERMSDMARQSLREKKAELQRALNGRLTEAQRWILKELLDRYSSTQLAIRRVQERIDLEVKNSEDPFLDEAITLLDTIPGVGRVAAQMIVGEIGTNMGQFPTSGHLASWAGMCPGNNESAGKRKSGKTMKGDRYLKAALVQAAWAASHTKNTYLSAQYRRLVGRIGKKRALIAVGHSILVTTYYVLSTRQDYKELGGDYFDRKRTGDHAQRLVKQLRALGFQVTLDRVA